MTIGLGHMQISPPVFWSMTPREFFAAANGYVQRMGGSTDEPLTKAEVQAMFDEYEKTGKVSVNVH